jgi:hypothetical protein
LLGINRTVPEVISAMPGRRLIYRLYARRHRSQPGPDLVIRTSGDFREIDFLRALRSFAAPLRPVSHPPFRARAPFLHPKGDGLS